MQENALMMANDEFMVKYDAAIKEIEEIRNKKREEFVKINDSANQVFNSLQPILDSYWDKIEEAAMQVIDNFQMSSDDFKKDQLKIVSAKLTEKIRESISMISHDMRTPLTSIIGYLQVAERTEDASEKNANIEIALERAKYLNKLVNDFFTFE